MDSTKTPVSNTFIRSPLPNQQQQIYFQHQKPPQSFRLDSLAPFSTLQQQQFAISKQQSLQRKQQPLLENVAPLLQHNNIRKNLFVPNTTQSINQHHNSSQALAERFVCRNSPPPSREQLDLDKNHKKHHPQIWCGKGQTEPTVSKHVYNYAQRKSSSEKTPMCRVAELTRYNKLRHGYVLLDESGPAHKKKFTVKLVLCPGQEFEGSGPSIKKAQQAAAQCALDSSTLPRPPPIIGGSRRHTRKDEPFNAILLLNSVAAQLGIFVNYKEELIRHPMPSFKSSLLNPAHLSWNTPFCSISNNNKLAPFSTMQPNTLNIADSQCFAPPPNLFTDTTFSNPLTNAIPTQKQIVPTSKSLSSILDLSIMPLVNASPVEADVSFRKMPNASINSLPLFGYRCFSFLPSSFLSLPSSILFNGIGRTNGQNFGPTALNSIL